MHFGSVQFEMQVQTHFVFCTSLSGQTYQVKSKRSVPLALLHNDFLSETCTTTQTFVNLCSISLGAVSLLCPLNTFSALCYCLCLLQYELKKESTQVVCI